MYSVLRTDHQTGQAFIQSARVGRRLGVRGGKEGKGKEEEEGAEEAVRDHLTSQTMHDSRRTERIGPHLFSSPRGEGGTKSWVIGKK